MIADSDAGQALKIEAQTTQPIPPSPIETPTPQDPIPPQNPPLPDVPVPGTIPPRDDLAFVRALAQYAERYRWPIAARLSNF